jgi:hypothetical protein
MKFFVFFLLLVTLLFAPLFREARGLSRLSERVGSMGRELARSVSVGETSFSGGRSAGEP